MNNDKERLDKVLKVVLLESLDVLKEAVFTLGDASNEYRNGYENGLKHFEKVADLFNEFKEEDMKNEKENH